MRCRSWPPGSRRWSLRDEGGSANQDAARDTESEQWKVVIFITMRTSEVVWMHSERKLVWKDWMARRRSGDSTTWCWRALVPLRRGAMSR